MGQFGFLDRFRLHKGDALKFNFRELAADGEVWSLAADLEDCEHDWRHVGTPG
mgnify:CR=1 FL=1